MPSPSLLPEAIARAAEVASRDGANTPGYCGSPTCVGIDSHPGGRLRASILSHQNSQMARVSQEGLLGGWKIGALDVP